MNLAFQKYQGTGNDFVIIDNRELLWAPEVSHVSNICDRRFGVGADGLILIQDHTEYDFEMIYFNSDGSKSLCGNGSRCAIHFAKSLNIISSRAKFLTTDGVHEARIDSDQISFQLFDVNEMKKIGDDLFINTGSPHYIRFVQNVDQVNVFEQGRQIRNDPRFASDGTNVNFVEIMDQSTICVRTYERGVENETLSCGTGVTASAIAAQSKGLKSPIKIKTKGGNLEVSFKANDSIYQDIWLKGPAVPVFSGTVSV